MPQLALGNGPTWGAIGFVAVRALELLLRDPPPQLGGLAVSCPAPAPAADSDWRLEVCEARLDAERRCPVPVLPLPVPPQEIVGFRALHGGVATAAGSLLTVLVQLFVRCVRRCGCRRADAAQQDAGDQGPQVHHGLQQRRRLAGVVV